MLYSIFCQNFSKTLNLIEHILRGSPPPPTWRYGHIMAAYDRHLYIFGGGAADNNLSNDVHCFDLDTQTWSIISPSPDSQVPSGRLFHAASVVRDALYVYGGTVEHNCRSGEMYRFQLASFPKCTLHDDFGRLLRSGQFTDINFLVGERDELVPAHIALVAARSSWLRARIRESRQARARHIDKLFRETEGRPTDLDCPLLEVRLVDADPDAFKMVLDFIYTDQIDPTRGERERHATNEIVLLMMKVISNRNKNDFFAI